ncbi:OmpA family protein [Phaeodactylibacter xiamenensis]|uniref:OmpA family protein n=1 Tax=Phaeodactylibacter xiamenensis TaxID=1524460 RepID=UPI003CCBDD04
MKRFIVCLLCGFIFSGVFAQRSESVKGWSVGTEKGYAQIAGEVKPGSGFGFGLYGDWAFNNFLSTRLFLGMGEARGLDESTSTNWLNHPVWNGSVDPDINYNNATSNSIYANYRMMYMEASLQAVFTYTQLPFFKNNSPFDGFLTAGVGVMRYNTRIDAAREDGLIYDFTFVDITPVSTKAQIIANVSTFGDGNYETQSQPEPQITPLYQLGAGFKWRIRKNISLSLTHRVSMAGTDDLDSYQWDENNRLNGVNDIHHFSTIGVSYTFRKRAKQQSPEPLPLTTEPEQEVVPEPKPEPEIAVTPKPEPKPKIVEEPKPVLPTKPSVDLVELTTDEAEVVNRAFENTEFETDKAVIRPRSFESLNELALLLSEHPNWKLRITGHTDNTGTAEWNMDLSRRRAEAVREYLANRDIDTERFIVAWFGEERPIADNSTAEGRQRNRRVAYEIVE